MWVPSINFLGYIFGPDQGATVIDWSTPKIAKNLQWFLGLTNSCFNFIWGFSSIMHSLTPQEGVKCLAWNPAAEKDLNQLSPIHRGPLSLRWMLLRQRMEPSYLSSSGTSPSYIPWLSAPECYILPRIMILKPNCKWLEVGTKLFTRFTDHKNYQLVLTNVLSGWISGTGPGLCPELSVTLNHPAEVFSMCVWVNSLCCFPEIPAPVTHHPWMNGSGGVKKYGKAPTSILNKWPRWIRRRIQMREKREPPSLPAGIWVWLATSDFSQLQTCIKLSPRYLTSMYWNRLMKSSPSWISPDTAA